MATLLERKAYSYREDSAVPDFDDSKKIAVMDGDCALCSRGARIIARFDKAEKFLICPVQSKTGDALVRHYGLDPLNPETWLLLEDGQAWSGMDAIIRIGELLGGAGRVATLMRVFPPRFREWVYRRIAHNRYRFGKSDMCATPSERLRRRLIM